MSAIKARLSNPRGPTVIKSTSSVVPALCPNPLPSYSVSLTSRESFSHLAVCFLFLWSYLVLVGLTLYLPPLLNCLSLTLFVIVWSAFYRFTADGWNVCRCSSCLQVSPSLKAAVHSKENKKQNCKTKNCNNCKLYPCQQRYFELRYVLNLFTFVRVSYPVFLVFKWLWCGLTLRWL